MNKQQIDKMIKEKENNSEIKESIRPQTFDKYIGQEKIKEIVKIYISAAKSRNEPLEHMLFYGPPGLGKTTIAGIIANEMGSNVHILTGPNIEKAGDIVSVLMSVNDGDIVFIDEIHRINRAVEEILYPAMEDFVVDIKINENSSKQEIIRLNLPKFTLMGATTRVGMLSSPLRDRFGLINRMEYYNNNELALIVKNSAKVLNVKINEEGCLEIAKRSRGTPRLANRLLKQVRNFAEVKYQANINKDVVLEVLDFVGIDNCGLDNNDIRYLTAIYTIGNGKAVGLTTLASAISEDVGTIEDVYEPFLITEGFLNKTSRGRQLTDRAIKHLRLN
jgi:Holliday junction DNA helicase RuvB